MKIDDLDFLGALSTVTGSFIVLFKEKQNAWLGGGGVASKCCKKSSSGSKMYEDEIESVSITWKDFFNHIKVLSWRVK